MRFSVTQCVGLTGRPPSRILPGYMTYAERGHLLSGVDQVLEGQEVTTAKRRRTGPSGGRVGASDTLTIASRELGMGGAACGS